MRATTLTKPGPVQQPPTEPEATPAGWCTTRADPHTSWTEPRGPVKSLKKPPERRECFGREALRHEPPQKTGRPVTAVKHSR